MSRRSPSRPRVTTDGPGPGSDPDADPDGVVAWLATQCFYVGVGVLVTGAIVGVAAGLVTAVSAAPRLTVWVLAGGLAVGAGWLVGGVLFSDHAVRESPPSRDLMDRAAKREQLRREMQLLVDETETEDEPDEPACEPDHDHDPDITAEHLSGDYSIGMTDADRSGGDDT